MIFTFVTFGVIFPKLLGRFQPHFNPKFARFRRIDFNDFWKTTTFLKYKKPILYVHAKKRTFDISDILEFRCHFWTFWVPTIYQKKCQIKIPNPSYILFRPKSKKIQLFCKIHKYLSRKLSHSSKNFMCNV